MAQRWIITGASGQLGGHVLLELRRAQPKAALLALTGRGRVALGGIPLARIDLRNEPALRALLAAYRPTHVLHIGALTSVAECHKSPDDAQRVNVEATRVLAQAAAGARMVFTSTDMVFGGDHAPYAESAAPDATSVYGRSKIAAEQALADVAQPPSADVAQPPSAVVAQPPSGVVAQPPSAVQAAQPPSPRTLIVRLPLLYGLPATDRPTTFAQQVTALRAGEPLKLFIDEHRTPLSLADAARALVALACSELTGLIHLAGPERLSRYELIERVAGALEIANPRLEPVSRLSIAALEPRPADLSLDAARFARDFPQLAPRPLARETITAGRSAQ